jgi:hypothetical protein
MRNRFGILVEMEEIVEMELSGDDYGLGDPLENVPNPVGEELLARVPRTMIQHIFPTGMVR